MKLFLFLDWLKEGGKIKKEKKRQKDKKQEQNDNHQRNRFHSFTQLFERKSRSRKYVITDVKSDNEINRDADQDCPRSSPGPNRGSPSITMQSEKIDHEINGDADWLKEGGKIKKEKKRQKDKKQEQNDNHQRNRFHSFTQLFERKSKSRKYVITDVKRNEATENIAASKTRRSCFGIGCFTSCFRKQAK
ncbi:probable ATP-dependent RNA helicase DDX46 isoform X1 [Antechinus flavipes]|uniref:probable ATP-dependent RNA helicase DDX46 isoform X1 n=1 Tax=Antechinus flavipes TaxID=38775 RepID=UPI002235AF21|nr:probable ATP-dependent RNA helicase DDX46 isoform X1 [Antechinus flavipes]